MVHQLTTYESVLLGFIYLISVEFHVTTLRRVLIKRNSRVGCTRHLVPFVQSEFGTSELWSER